LVDLHQKWPEKDNEENNSFQNLDKGSLGKCYIACTQTNDECLGSSHSDNLNEIIFNDQ
jgi:hypothetical protein